MFVPRPIRSRDVMRLGVENLFDAKLRLSTCSGSLCTRSSGCSSWTEDVRLAEVVSAEGRPSTSGSVWFKRPVDRQYPINGGRL